MKGFLSKFETFLAEQFGLSKFPTKRIERREQDKNGMVLLLEGMPFEKCYFLRNNRLKYSEIEGYYHNCDALGGIIKMHADDPRIEQLDEQWTQSWEPYELIMEQRALESDLGSDGDNNSFADETDDDYSTADESSHQSNPLNADQEAATEPRPERHIRFRPY